MAIKVGGVTMTEVGPRVADAVAFVLLRYGATGLNTAYFVQWPNWWQNFFEF